MDTLSDIRTATREDLETYLESWGFAVYSGEDDDLLRATAVDTFVTEGPGMGPLA